MIAGTRQTRIRNFTKLIQGKIGFRHINGCFLTKRFYGQQNPHGHALIWGFNIRPFKKKSILLFEIRVWHLISSIKGKSLNFSSVSSLTSWQIQDPGIYSVQGAHFSCKLPCRVETGKSQSSVGHSLLHWWYQCHIAKKQCTFIHWRGHPWPPAWWSKHAFTLVLQ